MQNAPPEATSRKAFLEDLDRQVAAARRAGAFTAILALAQDHVARLRSEFASLTEGLTLTWTMGPRQTEPSPLEIRLDELQWETRQWESVAERAGEYAANEAHGWTILPDGSCTKRLENGNVISARTSVRCDDASVRPRKSAAARRPAVRRHQSRGRAKRPAARRTAKVTSGDDPGDDGPGEPVVWLIRHRDGRDYIGWDVDRDASFTTATVLQRVRYGPGNSLIRLHGEPTRKRWPSRHIRDMLEVSQ